MIKLEGCLKNRRVFVVAGGPSVNSLDLSLLAGEFVITINRTFEKVPSFLSFSQDYEFYRNIRDGVYGSASLVKWREYSGLKVFLKPFVHQPFGPEVILLKRKQKEAVSLSPSEGLVGTNNSGAGAILLAVALGSREVYLLGYDLRLGESSHCHTGYGVSKADYGVELGKHLRDMVRVAKMVPKEVSVFNCNRDSALRCFPFAEFSEVLSNKS